MPAKVFCTSFSRSRSDGEEDHAKHGGGAREAAEPAKALTPEEIEAGVALMSKVDDATGRELYMGAGDREHD